MSHPETFVSCVKVKGINLLPPVITPKRRAELEKDRQQAIKLEKRLQQCRDLKKNLEDLLKLPSFTERPQSSVTFGDDSHIEDLGITSARSSVQSKRKSKLSKDILDVTEYSNDGIKIIKDMDALIECGQGQQLYSGIGSQGKETDTSVCKTDTSIFSKTNLIQSESDKESSSEQSCVEQNDNKVKTPSPRKSPRGRLIRSNSYTLEAPSPILLAHLEKCSRIKLKETESSPLSRTWTSLENNYIPFENSEFSSLNTVYNLNKDEEFEKNEIIQPEKDMNKAASPTIEVIQTDISVQQITVNANTENVEPVKTTFDLTDPDCQLMQVLKKIPEDYSKQIIELIEKQRLEHINKVDNFGKQFSNSTNRCSTPIQEFSQYDKSSISAVSASPSESVYYSICSTDTLKPTSPCINKVVELEIFEEENLKGAENGVIEDKGAAKKSDGTTEFNKKVFSTNYRNIDSIKKEWAACVISAHVKGYLTRRLLKTERVQSLIDTIRDALLCALQLHTVENIDEADIELHRRLINQVSAACYSFHDIFFALSIPEKMSIISSDRKRKMEKARRPKSTPDLRRSVSNSSRSSTKSASSMTRSLTKI